MSQENRAHNPKVAGSNPVPATIKRITKGKTGSYATRLESKLSLARDADLLSILLSVVCQFSITSRSGHLRTTVCTTFPLRDYRVRDVPILL